MRKKGYSNERKFNKPMMQKKIGEFLPSERRMVQAPYEMLNNMVCGGGVKCAGREGPRKRPEICWYLAERPGGTESRWHRELFDQSVLDIIFG